MTKPDSKVIARRLGNSTGHTRTSELLFHLRASIHILRRAVSDVFEGTRRCEKMGDRSFSMVVGLSRSALWTDRRPGEAAYQRGKVQNLRTAAQELDGALLLPGHVFSFWREIGRATRERGYAVGRMLQQGCMIPAVGGGLCQLSNALYDAALQAGCEIVERHAHSRVVPGSAAAAGRDATVAWNYVDLRFRSRVPLLVRAQVTDDELVVTFCAFPGAVVPGEKRAGEDHASSASQLASTCATCEETSCFRHEGSEKLP